MRGLAPEKNPVVVAAAASLRREENNFLSRPLVFPSKENCVVESMLWWRTAQCAWHSVGYSSFLQYLEYVPAIHAGCCVVVDELR